MENILCPICQQLKSSDKDFYKNGKGKIILPCKSCIKQKNASYHKNNKDKISKRKITHYNENKEDILERVKSYQTDNRDKISLQKKSYYQDNREEKLFKQIKYRAKGSKRYYLNHKNEPNFKIRRRLSTSIYRSLKRNGSDKALQSCLKYLSYTVQELKVHLETQFEPWMTWDNWGNYNKETWDDGDISTWTWQLDHIIPHSTFKYLSMDDEGFKKCWALENLRPLSAKQNNFDGVSRVRH